MIALGVFIGAILTLLFFRSFQMSAALDRLTASVAANTAAITALVAAYQNAPNEASINALADQVDQSTAAANAVLSTP